MIRQCDAGGICGHIPQCDHFCHFTNAELETRRMAPLIRFVEEAEPVPETWQVIGSVLVGFVLAALFVICLALFFTGLWVWSLLI
jgi:hypothetical protein